MTELEQKLLDELEALEIDRSKKDESFRQLKEQYEESIKKLSNSLALEYQESLTKLMQSENSEQESLVTYLKTLTQQQQQLIRLLQKPPQSEGLEEKLNGVLQPLFRQLQTEYSNSNEALITELKALLDSSESEY